jgi:hypothetical protein
MSTQIGEFPGLASSSRRQIRSIPNPLDKSTIVSIFPDLIEEPKPTTQPNKYVIQPGTFDNPSILVIGPAIWWKDFMDDQPLTEMVVSSIQQADSIIKDYCNSMLGCDMDTAIPGLFFIPGEVSILEVKTKYKTKLTEVKAKQDNWFRILVKKADSDWARSNGNPIFIWDGMRLAARELNLTDKPWLKDYQTMEKVKCFACGSLKDPVYPICPTCRSIDPSNPLSKDLKIAV